MDSRGTDHFKKHMSNLFRARFPYTYIATYEEERALSAIRSLAKEEALIKTPRQVFTWRLTSGLRNDNQPHREETKAPLKALEFIEKYDEPAIFILQDFQIFFGCAGCQTDHTVIRKLRDLVTALKQSPNPKNVVFLGSSVFLPNDLQKDVTIVDFDLPSLEEVTAVLDEMIEANRASGRIQIDLTPDEKERLAKAALGLTLHEAENAFARAMVHDGRLCIEDLDIILEEKRQTIKKQGILEFIKSDLNMDDVGGLENLKRWLKKRDKSWMDSAAIYGLPAPKGVLITGVPGCGKSLIAKAISSMWHLPLLRLDVGAIFQGIVGSSEENMRKAIAVAEAISPSILWIDEIEKGFSGVGSNNDSGTSSRVFGTFLTWMQEKTNAVFVIATANNIHSLPPELMRKGRFDEIFFVDLPTRKERMDIFNLHLKKRLKHPEAVGDFMINDQLLEHLSDQSEGFIGAEIEQAVITGLFEAFSEDRSIRLEDFDKAIVNTVPLSVTQAEQIRGIREWANVRAVAATPQEDRVEYAKNPVTVGAAAPLGGDTKPEDDISSTRGGRAVDF